MVARSMETTNARIVQLIDHAQPMDLEFFFPNVPIESWSKYRTLYPELFANPTQLNFKFSSYLIQTESQNILVDTGIGSATSPFCVHNGIEGHLPENLEVEGLSPEDINTIIFTHLHPDHVGWNTILDKDNWRLMFPQANFIVRKEDWDTLSKKEVQALFEHPFFYECIQPLETSNKLKLISNEINFTDLIKLIHCPGHTPGSMGVIIDSEDMRVMLCGDLFTSPAQFYNPDWAYTFDMSSEDACNTRNKIIRLAVDQSLILAATHFSGFWQQMDVNGESIWKAL